MFYLSYCFIIPEEPHKRSGQLTLLFFVIYYLKYKAVYNASSKPFPLLE